MRTAIVHDWLVVYGGAERALEQIIEIFPDADLYSLVDFLPHDERSFIHDKKVTTSFLQSFPFAKKQYRSYLPFMPLAIEQLDLSDYDLVISSSHAVAKGVLTYTGQLHVCYCYTPVRYAWDLYHQYLHEAKLDKGFRGLMAKMILHYIRIWDFTTANRVQHFAAISQYIAKRIKKIYGREAAVIYPPVDIENFQPHPKKDDYYLTASRMVPYKKVDLIVETFSQMPDKKLVVIGDGPDLQKVRSKAGRNIELLGYQPTSVMKEYLQKAKAFVYAAEEDFGIVTVEAQACATPVIAFGRGGTRETVTEGVTGIYFSEQTPTAIRDAIRKFDMIQNSFEPHKLRSNAERFGKERFKKEFKEFVDRAIQQHWS